MGFCRVQPYGSIGLLVSFFMSKISYKYSFLYSECLTILNISQCVVFILFILVFDFVVFFRIDTYLHKILCLSKFVVQKDNRLHMRLSNSGVL